MLLVYEEETEDELDEGDSRDCCSKVLIISLASNQSSS